MWLELGDRVLFCLVLMESTIQMQSKRWPLTLSETICSGVKHLYWQYQVESFELTATGNLGGTRARRNGCSHDDVDSWGQWDLQGSRKVREQTDSWSNCLSGCHFASDPWVKQGIMVVAMMDPHQLAEAYQRQTHHALSPQ